MIEKALSGNHDNMVNISANQEMSLGERQQYEVKIAQLVE